MSAWREDQPGLRAKPEACAIAVVYENVPSRTLAIEVCDGLAQKFMGDLEFEISWWRFDYLADPLVAHEAAQAAIQSDLILVCLSADELPANIKSWFEEWLPHHQVPEAAMALVRTSVASGEATAADIYLRLAARRAKLEYLPLESSTRTGDRLREDDRSSDTAGMDQAPDHPYHSSGWGINE